MCKRIAFLTFVAVVSLLNPGCSEPESVVSGKVTIEDGQPLKEGDIIFEDVENKVPAASAKIVDGAYTIKVQPGKKTVRIIATRPGKKIDPVMGAAPRESMIPEQFNEKSKLTADVTAGKHEGVNFEVKTLP